MKSVTKLNGYIVTTGRARHCVRAAAFSIFYLLTASFSFGQGPTNTNDIASSRAVMVTTNSVLAAPVDFFSKNSNALNAAISTTALAATNISATNVTASNHYGTNFIGGTFTGTYIGNGAAITNISTNQLSAVNVLAYGAAGDGVTDDTTAFYKALATGCPVYAPAWKTNGYVVSNLILTNNGIFSSGAHLLFKAGATGFMIETAPPIVGPTYANTNIDYSRSFLRGLVLDGGGGTNIPTSLGTRHAVWFDPYQQNSTMEDVTITGFSGYGCMDCSSRPFASFQTQPALSYPSYGQMRNCRAFYCYRGVIQFSGTPPTIGFADTYFSEYTVVTGWECASNFCGIEVGSGNHYISGCMFNANYTGAIISSNQNNGHGVFSMCSFNHNITNGVLATNIAYGFNFVGCVQFGASNYWLGCTGMYWDGGVLGGVSFYFDGGGLNAVRFAHTISTFGYPSFTHLNSDHSIAYMNDNPGGGGNTAPDVLIPQLMPATMGTVAITNLGLPAAGTLGVTNGLTVNGDATQGQVFGHVVYDANVGTNLTVQFNNTTLVSVPAAGGTYEIYVDEQSTHAGTAGTLTTIFNYTDQFNSALSAGMNGATNMTLTLGAASGQHTNAVGFVKCKGGTTIGISTSISGGGGGSTYSLDIDILRIR